MIDEGGSGVQYTQAWQDALKFKQKLEKSGDMNLVNSFVHKIDTEIRFTSVHFK